MVAATAALSAISHVVQEKTVRGKKMYLVRWLGYSRKYVIDNLFFALFKP